MRFFRQLQKRARSRRAMCRCGLPYGVAPLFEEWLTLHRPLQKEKILNRIRDIRGGRLNDPNFTNANAGQRRICGAHLGVV